MRCPKCKQRALCVDTREQMDGMLRRRRYECVAEDCGIRFNTLEDIVAIGDGRGKKGNGQFLFFRSERDRAVERQVKARLKSAMLSVLDA